jgi:hypothetical protein
MTRTLQARLVRPNERPPHLTGSDQTRQRLTSQLMRRYRADDPAPHAIRTRTWPGSRDLSERQRACQKRRSERHRRQPTGRSEHRAGQNTGRSERRAGSGADWFCLAPASRRSWGVRLGECADGARSCA